MNKLQVDKRDAERILLTEVLPYETPLFFSNALLYKFARRAAAQKSPKVPALIERLLRLGERDSTIPYQYEISNKGGSRRKLSVIHPSSQLCFVNFYKESDKYITYLCQKSDFSLRAPADIATYYYEKRLRGEDIDSRDLAPEVEMEAFDEQARYASSYFLYNRYAFLYKFFESHEFIRLEKRFQSLLRFDVSRCFESLYTHSIAWAVKGKIPAKDARNRRSFEDTFDGLMRRCNFDETHGIVVGPEVSRIFAEIILQRIDIEAKRELDALGLRFKVDYHVRRYIDDYFVFSNSDETQKCIFDIFQSRLSEYKMHVNQSKTGYDTRPFAPPQSLAKQSAREVLERAFCEIIDLKVVDSPLNDKAKLFRVKSAFKTANKVIDQIKVAIKNSGTGYEGTTGYCLSMIRRLIDEAFSKKRIKHWEAEVAGAREFLLALLDVALFLYAMDMRVRPTYLICQIVVMADGLAKKLGEEEYDAVHKKIIDELVDALERAKAIGRTTSIETANLLVVFRSLERSFDLPINHLASYFDLKLQPKGAGSNSKGEGFMRLDCFEILTMLYYIEDRPTYSVIRDGLLQEVEARFTASDRPHRDSALTLLFLELVASPKVPADLKRRLIAKMSSSLLKTKSIPDDKANEIINYCRKFLHFVDWSGALDVSYALKKRELRTPYGD